MNDARPPAPGGGNLVTPRDARIWLDALDELRARGAGRPPGGVWIIEPVGNWHRRASYGCARGLLVIALPEAKGYNLRGLYGLTVAAFPNHDLDSAAWSAEMIPALAAASPYMLLLHAGNWGPYIDAQVILSNAPKDPRGALPPDAPWGATWDWIDDRALFYDRLIDYCIGEGWEIPAWVQKASARITGWVEGEGSYGR